MYIQMIIPGVDEYLARGIQNLGEAASLFFKTDRRTQKAIRHALIENPDLIQKFSDLETNAPGSLEELGFGPVADLIRKTPESIQSQIQRIIGGPSVSATRDIISKPENVQDIARGGLGLPSTTESKIQNRQGQVAETLTTATENVPVDINSIGPIIDRFLETGEGIGDIARIMSHPTMGPAAELYYNNKVNELEETKSKTAITADVKNQFAAIAPVRRSLQEYSTKVREFMSKPLHQRIAAFAGRGPLVQELGNIQSLQAGLMGTFRPLLSPGPLSRADMAMLQRMLGNIVSIQSFIRGESFVEGQLLGVESFVENKIRGLQELYPSMIVPDSNIPTINTTGPRININTQTPTTNTQQSQFQLQPDVSNVRPTTRRRGTYTDTARRRDTIGAGLTPRTDSINFEGNIIPMSVVDSIGVKNNYDPTKSARELREWTRKNRR